MATVQPGPSNGGTALTRTAAARQLTCPCIRSQAACASATLSC
jgi:hypothetical protein